MRCLCRRRHWYCAFSVTLRADTRETTSQYECQEGRSGRTANDASDCRNEGCSPGRPCVGLKTYTHPPDRALEHYGVTDSMTEFMCYRHLGGTDLRCSRADRSGFEVVCIQGNRAARPLDFALPELTGRDLGHGDNPMRLRDDPADIEVDRNPPTRKPLCEIGFPDHAEGCAIASSCPDRAVCPLMEVPLLIRCPRSESWLHFPYVLPVFLQENSPHQLVSISMVHQAVSLKTWPMGKLSCKSCSHCIVPKNTPATRTEQIVCSLRDHNPTEQETTSRAGRKLHLGARLSACGDLYCRRQAHGKTANRIYRKIPWNFLCLNTFHASKAWAAAVAPAPPCRKLGGSFSNKI